MLWSLAVLVITLGGAEGLLRVVASPGFLGRAFVPAGDGRWRFFREDPDQAFASPKPPGTFRIFCFGESAVIGWMYDPYSSFPGHLQQMLRAQSRRVKVEVINCGESGVDSKGVLEFVQQSLRFEPDLLLIYCGNNERGHYRRFKQFQLSPSNKIFQALKRHSYIVQAVNHQVDQLKIKYVHLQSHDADPGPSLDWDLLSESDRKSIRDDYLANIRAMIETGKARGIPVLVCAVAMNSFDWPPVISRHPAAMTRNEREASDETVAAAERALHDGSLEQAASLLQRVLSSEPDNARARFLLGRCLFEQGDPAGARANLKRAVDGDDIIISRACPYHNQGLLEMARAQGVMTLDLESFFDAHSQAGVAGLDWFDDYCHFNLDGQVLAAAKLSQTITDAFPELFAPADPQALFDRKDEWLAQTSLSPERLAAKLQPMAFYLGFDYDEWYINNAAVSLLERFAQAVPDSVLPDLAIGLVRLRQGEAGAGREMFRRALLLDPEQTGLIGDAYFIRYIRFQGSWMVVRAAPGTDFHFLQSDSVLLKDPRNAGRVKKITLDQAQYFFHWDASTATLEDVSDRLGARVRERRLLAAKTQSDSSLLAPGSDPDRLYHLIPQGLGKYQAAGPDPYFLFPGLSAPAPLLGEVIVVGRITPDPGRPGERVCLYWTSPGRPGFDEDRKTCSRDTIDDSRREYRLDLANDPEWLLTDELSGFRLDPGETPLSLQIEKIELVPWTGTQPDPPPSSR